MEKSKTRLLIPIIGGILLIAVGVLLLLDTLGVFQFAWGMLIGPLIGLGGLVFLAVFILFKKEWWAVIPGFILIAVGLTIFMDQQVQDFSGRWGSLHFHEYLRAGFPFGLYHPSRKLVGDHPSRGIDHIGWDQFIGWSGLAAGWAALFGSCADLWSGVYSAKTRWKIEMGALSSCNLVGNQHCRLLGGRKLNQFCLAGSTTDCWRVRRLPSAAATKIVQF